MYNLLLLSPPSSPSYFHQLCKNIQQNHPIERNPLFCIYVLDLLLVDIQDKCNKAECFQLLYTDHYHSVFYIICSMQSAKPTSLLLQITQKCDAHQIISLLDYTNNTTISALEYICKIRKNDLNEDFDDFSKNIDSFLEYLNTSETSDRYHFFKMELSSS